MLLNPADPFVQQAREISASRQDDYLEERGLDPWELNQAWSTGYGQPRLPDGTPNPKYMTREDYRILNLAHVVAIEEKFGEGATATLRQSHGLRSFGRPSLDLLDYMVTNRCREAARVILIATAIDSPNNQAMVAAYQMARQLAARVPKDTVVEPVEIGKMPDFSLAEPLVRRHGPNAGLHTVILNAHGGSDGLTLNRVSFGRSGNWWRFGPEDIGFFVDALGGVAIPELTVVLAACGTGTKPDGFAKTLNKRTGWRTLAAGEDNVAIRDITIRDSNGILRPHIVYHKKTGKGWEPSITRRLRLSPLERAQVHPPDKS